jgi:cytochrome c-type biogenesis protein CcmH
MKHWLALSLFLAAPALADSPLAGPELANTQLTDPAKEAQAKNLMLTIRCLVCQGQSIADSNAEMAGDMRALIRQRVNSGESPDVIRAWLVERYGAWVSYEPPFTGFSAAVWLMPFLFLGFGVLLVNGRFKRKSP